MNDLRPLQLFVTVVPVLSAGLYLLGLTYHQGYLAEYALDDSLFPLASDQALFRGFFSFITLSIPSALYAITAFILLILAVVISAVLSSTARVKEWSLWTRGLVLTLRGKKTVPAAATDFLDKSAIWYGYFVGFVLLLLALLLMSALSERNGRKQAEQEIKQFSGGKGMQTQVWPSPAELQATSRLVICSDKHCAFWTGNASVVLRHELIERTVSSRIKELSVGAAAASSNASQAAASAPK